MMSKTSYVFEILGLIKTIELAQWEIQNRLYNEAKDTLEVLTKELKDFAK